MPDIEFVDPDPEPGQDEDLDVAPRRQWSPRAGRTARLGAAVALAAVAGSVLVASLHHGSTGTRAVGSSFTADAVRAPEAPSGAFRVDHLGGDAPEGARPGTLAGRSSAPTPTSSTVAAGSTVTVPIDCPVVDACEVQLQFPVAVFFAVQARLPSVTGLEGGTVVVRGPHPTLRSRQLTAHAGRVAVRIVVEPATGRDHARSSSSSVGAGTSVSATAVVGGFRVTVTVSGPDTAVPGSGAVRALAADRRLLVVA